MTLLRSAYFCHQGSWYEYFTGQTINVNSSTTSLVLSAGEYRLYTDVNIPGGTSQFHVQENELDELLVYPNPNSGDFRLIHAEELVLVELYNNTGASIPVSVEQGLIHVISSESLSKGVYYVHAVTKSNKQFLKPIIIE